MTKTRFNSSESESSYRKEQFRLKKYFEVYAPEIQVELEFKVYDVERELYYSIDLADLTNRIAWELDGESHTPRRKIRDDERDYFLESLGWKIIRIPKDSWNWWWLWD